MMTFIDKLSRKLAAINESVDPSIKDFHNPNYDRQYAEDLLYHTIGPLTDTPRFTGSWSSRSKPPEGFTPNGPAPQWTPDELIMAFAGDPQLLFKSSDNPRSPGYGDKGGAPLFRSAKKVARIYNRERDKSFISDLYSNGFIPLVQMMQPGYDQSRSPFISYVTRNVLSAMEHGVGGTNAGIRAKGGESTTGAHGLQNILELTDPDKIEQLANQVKGEFQSNKSHARHDDNPFGAYSSRFYNVSMNYAKALRSGDEEAINKARNAINQLIEEIEDEMIPVLGASTGIGQAISTNDRTSSVNLQSIDQERGESGKSSADTIVGQDENSSSVDQATIQYVLNISLKHDLKAIIGGSTILQKQLSDAGINLEDIGGRMTGNEFRYMLRQLGPLAGEYPGKGNLRQNLKAARDSNGWWKPGEDPEIEPTKDGGEWESIWLRNNMPHMGPTEIAQEMTQEVKEFNELGIATARKIKSKTDNRTGRVFEEVVSKVAVSNTFQAALLKIKAIALIYRAELGMDEGKRSRSNIIFESLDIVDRDLIVETCDWLVKRTNRMLAKTFITDFIKVIS